MAQSYIAAFEVRGYDAVSVLPELETLTHVQARRLLEAPWPTATLEIIACDPRWLDHLDALEAPFSIRERALPEPIQEEPRPRDEAPILPDERRVLWCDEGARVMWQVERFGAELRRRWGKREREDRASDATTYASAEVAAEQLRREVAAKRDVGYVLLRSADEVLAEVEAVLGVTFASSSPPVIASCDDPAQRVDDMQRLRPKDVILSVGGSYGDRVFTLEALGESLRRRSWAAYVGYWRPASRSQTGIWRSR